MAIPKEEVEQSQTYRTAGGKLVYVQYVTDDKVIWNTVGQLERNETSLGRFASRLNCAVPNG